MQSEEMIRRIIIKQSVRQTIIQETLKFRKLETGGVFCGYYRDDAVVLVAASGPGPKATHSITGFEIDENFMYAFIEQEYQRSNGQDIYVGEWHTHPQIVPVPSDQDYDSVAERADEWKHGELVYIIIGFVNFNAKKMNDQMIAFRFDKDSKTLIGLPVAYE